MKIKFKLIGEQRIEIYSGNKKIGQIFTPSGSGNDCTNAIQICGFSEAFDLWGCGIFSGFKDIQLLFDDKKMTGNHIQDRLGHDNCWGCYMEECQCDNKFSKIPFKVKSSNDLKDRLEGNYAEIVYKNFEPLDNKEDE